ncbi:expressed unknown protein [Seminavis robusta]|uniref:Uncharacterized protein n=1 Tax=Seminavis robusta TaxID=568900 RepID=A0A9N8HP41_9STRA|nr:expressed unknown protein [Seminavis robusta]|eukprot:Sro1036_g233990.1 n/a (353) ;mRNA; r:3446-4504
MATTSLGAAPPCRRSFGGKAGTWFTRRKPRNDTSTLKKTNGELSSQPNATIEWDHDKCRPIFKQAVPPKEPSNEEQDTDRNTTVARKHDGINIRLDFSDGMEKTTTSTSTNESNEEAPTKPKDPFDSKKRHQKSYGIRSRNKKRQKKCSELDSLNDSDDDESYCVGMLSQPQDFQPLNNRGSTKNESEEEDDNHTSTTIDTVTLARRVSTGSCLSLENKVEKDTFAFRDDDPVDDKKRTLVQSLCETPQTASLRVHREFFERLDRDHQLTIAAEPSTCRRLRRHETTGRSTYGVNSKKHLLTVAPKLTQEYNEYKVACEESNVTPIPKETYSANRSQYFESASELYDGFLDE